MKSKEQKRTEAEQRSAAYNQLTTTEKLARLPRDGAKRQRAKLMAKLRREGE